VGSRGGRNGVRFQVYDRTASGNAKPRWSVRGPVELGGPFAIYPAKQLIFATNRPQGTLSGEAAYLGVWSYETASEGPPLWQVGGPKGIFEMPRGVTLDVKNQSIIASDKRLNSVLTFRVPEIF
jgi:hypothetical protein